MATRPEEILGVRENATQTEVKARYRALAKRYHPDVNKGDATAEWVFKQIDHAYRTLTREQRRKGPGEHAKAGKARSEARNGSTQNGPEQSAGRNPGGADTEHARREAEETRQARRMWEEVHTENDRSRREQRNLGCVTAGAAGAFGGIVAYLGGAPTGLAMLIYGVFAAGITWIVWHLAMPPDG